MTSESWATKALGDVIRLKRGHDLPADRRQPGTVPVISSSGLSGFHSLAAAHGPGVVTGRYGTLGKTYYIKEDYWPLNTTLYVEDFKGNDPRFVAYLLSSLDLARHNDKSSVPGVNRNDLHRIGVRLPLSSDAQRAIAEVLGALDDKIDLNRRTNQTIQHLLHALFTQMPEDERAPIGELARVVGGSTPSTGELAYWSGGKHAWATPKDLAALSDPVLTRTARMITDAGLARVSSGLLPLGTVLLSSRAPIGYLAVSEIAIAVNQGFIAMVPNGTVSSLFLLQWAQSHLDDIKARANGTTFLEISKANFRPMMVNLPSQSDRDRFDGIARPMHSLMVANVRENQALAGLRDALLPELISGRMTVRDAAAAG